MKRHVNTPLFIPHEGCPHACVFCDQRAIASKSSAVGRDVTAKIERTLATVGDGVPVEIAFFGGSFTALEPSVMEGLLKQAYPFVRDGRVDGIRLSTRPDAIDGDVLALLKAYGVTAIELGVQSLDDAVLAASGRGHTAYDSLRACALIKDAGFVLGGQMMIGLPQSTPESEIMTAKGLCGAQIDEARIYPTAVLAGTALADMTARGDYRPLSFDEALARSTDVYEIFLSHGATVLRIGLQASETLQAQTLAGGMPEAFGEYVKGEHYRRLIAEHLAQNAPCGGVLGVRCARGEASKVAGHGGRNKKALAGLVKAIRITEDERVKKHELLFS